MSTCNLSESNRCCCTCANHHEDFHHCTTNADLRNQQPKEPGKSACICNIHKGWVCFIPGGRLHSGWSEHGICEMHLNKLKLK